MPLLKKIIPILLLFLFSCRMMAQEKFSKGLYYEANVQIGRLIKNYPEFPERGASSFASVSIARQTYGRSIWNQWYNFPKTGLILTTGGFGNTDVLGQNISLQGFIGLNLIKKPKFSLETKISMGFAFFNKPYDYLGNPDNTLIGSTITNISQIGFLAYQKVNAHWGVKAGFSMMHYSDGHTALPNVGANIPLFQAGFRYFPNKRPYFIRLPDTIAVNHSWLMNLEAGLGMHEFGGTMGPVRGPKYPVYSLGINLQKRLGKIHMLSGGIYMNYYSSYFDFITSQDFYQTNLRLKSSTFIFYLGHEFIIGRLGLVSQLGLYLYNEFREDYTKGVENDRTGIKTINTNKLGVKYYFLSPTYSLKNNIFVGMYIKANAGQADFAEISAGISF